MILEVIARSDTMVLEDGRLQRVTTIFIRHTGNADKTVLDAAWRSIPDGFRRVMHRRRDFLYEHAREFIATYIEQQTIATGDP